MHADVVTAAVTSIKHGYVITASKDGVVKFWKRLKVTSSSVPATASTAAAPSAVSTPCLEFVKSFTAHAGPVRCLAIDSSTDICCSVGADDLLKFYDVATFDVTTMVASPYPLGDACCAVEGLSFGSGSGLLWAVSSALSGSIYIFSMDNQGELGDEDDDDDGTSNHRNKNKNLVETITLHGSNRITTLTTIPGRAAILSTDVKGIVEVWSTGKSLSALGSACTHAFNEIRYESKLDTDLYELVKNRTYCVAAAATSNLYALYCHDGRIRIFRYATGRIEAKLDERLKKYEKEQQNDTPEPDSSKDVGTSPTGLSKLDALEFGRRAAVERDIQSSAVMAQHLLANPADGEGVVSSAANQRMTLEFDQSGSYLLVPTLLGIKVLDWRRRKVRAILGEADASQLRFVSACLCPGDAKVNRQMELARMSAATTAATGASASAGDSKVSEQHKPVDDSLVIALAYEKQRLYVFSHIDPVMMQPSGSNDGEETQASLSTAAILSSRDVWNEAPSASDSLQLDALQSRHPSQMGGGKRLPARAILRTTMGDIHIQLFATQVPKTIENFAGHASSGYYDGVIFHRVIKGFMLQTGDPLGDGTGGESIWGGEFDDEFVPGLRHDRPFTVSMANAGPNTNGSQFYITTVPTPWLDQKHTVFGRVISGMDICTAIENVRTDDLDKPLNEIRIVNVDLVDSE